MDNNTALDSVIVTRDGNRKEYVGRILYISDSYVTMMPSEFKNPKRTEIVMEQEGPNPIDAPGPTGSQG